ncbi:hypothetical protein [Streptacidiphilus melanogenes]|uniref:hypothetical protein n=1 Tax=Streptacidiphilus melanogenes TaxID=411235 RepID=UPI0005A5FCD7|nr:hypothetical protein [Streptacidiphilus melanogenes]
MARLLPTRSALPARVPACLGVSAIVLLAVLGAGAGTAERHAGGDRALAAAGSCSGATDWNSIVTTGNPGCQLF